MKAARGLVLTLLCTVGCVLAVPVASAGALPVSFGSEGTGPGEMTEPRGIAVDQESGDVYVADTVNNRVDKFGPEGEFLLAWGWGVADGKTEALQTCTMTCFAGLEGSGAGEFNGVEGIAVDSSLGFSHGDIYVADTHNNRVQKFTPQGEFVLMFGGEVDETSKANVCTKGNLEAKEVCGAGVPGAGAGAFTALTKHAVAVDSATGTVYVADESRVQRFSEAGGVQSPQVAFPGGGFSQNLAVDSTGDIYLKSEELTGIRKYDPTGKELGSPRDVEAAHRGASDAITIGPGNELLVNDVSAGESHHIFAFNPAGAQTASFDAGGEAQGGGRGIAYSEHTGALYLINTAANEASVRIVTPPPPGPLILAGSQIASAIQPTTVSLGAMVNPEGSAASSYHFEYDTTAYAQGEAPHGQSTPETPLGGGELEFVDQSASAPVTKLQSGTLYHFRVIATNGTQTTEGPDQTFTTLPPVSIDAVSVSEVDDKSARLEAELNSHGIASEYHFEYDTSPYVEGQASHGISVPIPDRSVGAGTTPATVSELVQGLAPSTVYHYRVVAHNALGTSMSPDRSFTTQGPSATLPDGRSYELVSPPNKHGAPLEAITEEGGLIQATPSGGAFAYVALGPIGSESKGVRSPEDTQLLSRRNPTKGWSTQDITTPHEEISHIHLGQFSEYQLFAEDLSASVVEPIGATPLSNQTTERTPYRREAYGTFVPLVTASNVPEGTKFGGEEIEASGAWGDGVNFETATPDLSHIILRSSHLLSAGFKTGFEPEGNESLYELAGGVLTLVSVLPDGTPVAETGHTAFSRNGASHRGFISSDGNRVLFNSGGGLYLRDVALGRTLELDEPQPGASGDPGGGALQGASSDDSKVFFTDGSPLTVGASAKSNRPNLYMCEITVNAGEPSCALSDISVDPNKGESANVLGVTAVDQTGGHVYFTAFGVLTGSPNAQHEVAVPGAPNLYEYDTQSDQVHLVAVLSSGDEGLLEGKEPDLGRLTARSSPDGRFLVFMSQRSLTGYDNRDARSGQSDAEVYQFDATSDAVRCVACDPSGARPEGIFDPPREVYPGLLVDQRRSWRERWLAASVPGWTAQSVNVALYQSRYVSNSGRTFFNAADALVPQDKNKVEDVYQYEPPGVGSCTTASSTFSSVSGGCVNLISSGASKEESTFLDASENGDEVFFLTDSRLTSSDVDGAFDVYDAHVCSESSPCPSPPLAVPGCEGDSCQNPSSPPGEATPGSLTYNGPGNAVPPAATPAFKPKAKPLTSAQKLTKALKACKAKHNKKQRATCEKKARRTYAPKTKPKKTNRRAK